MSPTLPFKQALIIANPVSGQAKGERVGREIAGELAERGVAARLHLTQYAGDAEATVGDLDPQTDLLVSVGGDGTLREILTGLRRRGPECKPLPIGLLPMGTGNALGKDFSLPRDAKGAVDVFLTGKTAELDFADVNGELCFLAAGAGLDAHIVQHFHARRSGRSTTKWGYLPAGLRAFFGYQREPLTVELDDQELPGRFSQILACNMIHYGGLVKLSPDRRLGDGLFEIFLFPDVGRLGLIFHGLRLATCLIPGGGIKMQRARSIRITSASPVPYHVDGDPMGSTPVTIEVTSSRFQLLVP
ncbi:MAG: diacylglycerol kinase (ATP) [Planctomycetota bacterium]|jgi:diacylglycerol kinase (ATP)